MTRRGSGESLSFTAFLMTCLAKAVDEHKAVQARRLGSKRLIWAFSWFFPFRRHPHPMSWDVLMWLHDKPHALKEVYQ